ncbi:MAG TPA: Spo0E family sporulation regulatory protein-aspartic acid phosphatase [Clostridium sp.]
MSNLEDVEKTVYEMRQALHAIIDKKENLLDIEVINASQKVDEALDEYNNLLNKVVK